MLEASEANSFSFSPRSVLEAKTLESRESVAIIRAGAREREARTSVTSLPD